MSRDSDFTHLNPRGDARMVDVADKMPTYRVAEAEAWLWVGKELMEALRSGDVRKGDALAVARIAGISATKQTASWIPLAHPVPLTHAQVDIDLEEPERVRLRCRAEAVGRTGVEMEALCGVTAAALALYDMVKSKRRDAEIVNVRLLYKSGGKSGVFQRLHSDGLAPGSGAADASTGEVPTPASD
ncbi:MAG: cyclic pyranopterin monophosphate synthase MoaC [Myxococcota bacterium]